MQETALMELLLKVKTGEVDVFSAGSQILPMVTPEVSAAAALVPAQAQVIEVVPAQDDVRVIPVETDADQIAMLLNELRELKATQAKEAKRRREWEKSVHKREEAIRSRAGRCSSGGHSSSGGCGH